MLSQVCVDLSWAADFLDQRILGFSHVRFLKEISYWGRCGAQTTTEHASTRNASVLYDAMTAHVNNLTKEATCDLRFLFNIQL